MILKVSCAMRAGASAAAGTLSGRARCRPQDDVDLPQSVAFLPDGGHDGLVGGGQRLSGLVELDGDLGEQSGHAPVVEGDGPVGADGPTQQLQCLEPVVQSLAWHRRSAASSRS